MKRQSAVSEARVQSCPKRHRLILAPAVTDRVVSITFERNVREVPVHPNVESVVEKQFCQETADHPTLRLPPVSFDDTSVQHLHRRLQPSFNVQKHPLAIGVLAHCLHQKVRIDVVEESLDVEIKNPVVAPASLPRHTYRIERRFAWAVPIGILVELGIHLRFQMMFDHHLGYAVRNRGYAQRPCLAIALWDIDPPHRRLKVAARL